MMNIVTVTQDGPLTRVTLNRPDKLNSFNSQMVDDLLQAVLQAYGDGTRLLVLNAQGKGFSGGFDLDGLDASSDGDMLLRFVRVEQLLQAVYHAPFATLALSHGACFGAAADLVAACHRTVCAPGAKFRMPGPKFDVVLGTRRLATLVGAAPARRLLQRESPFSAEEAVKVGFIQEIAEQARWPEIIDETLSAALSLSATVSAEIASRTLVDTRDADMTALVKSVANGSITARLRAYVEQVRKSRPAR